MALQGSGPISLADIQGEFGGSNPISLSEYYGAAAGVPSSGAISFSDFYGAAANVGVELIGHFTGAANVTSQNFTVNLGNDTEPGGKTFIFVSGHANTQSSVALDTSMTLDGLGCPQRYSRAAGDKNTSIHASVTNKTGNKTLTVNYSGALNSKCRGAQVTVFRLHNVSSSIPAATADGWSINVPTNGCAIAVGNVIGGSASGGVNANWTLGGRAIVNTNNMVSGYIEGLYGSRTMSVPNDAYAAKIVCAFV